MRSYCLVLLVVAVIAVQHSDARRSSRLDSLARRDFADEEQEDKYLDEQLRAFLAKRDGSSLTNQSVISVEFEQTAVPVVKFYAVYYAYVTADTFNNAVSNNFVTIPDLRKIFHITRATFFKITYQGGVYNGGQERQQYVQIMVNNSLILANTLVPNTAARVQYGISSNIQIVDRVGGDYYVNTGNIQSMITRMAFVYLPAGTYTFDVGVRCEAGIVSNVGGFVNYELTQFENEDLQQVGAYVMATIPA